MIKYILLLIFLLPGVRTQDKRAAEIVKISDERMRGKTLQGEMIIRTVRPTYQREMDLKMWSIGNDYTLIQVLSPAKERGITYLKRKKEVWNWIPVLERTIKLPPSMMSQSWMGTDFTNDDLVKESSVVEDYDHTLVGEEKVGEWLCYKIQLIPKPAASVIWSKVIMWIDKQNYLQIKSESYDEDGKLVNTMLGSDVKMMGGRLMPTNLEMTPWGKPGQKTIIIYKSLLFDKSISDDFFSTQNMKNPK